MHVKISNLHLLLTIVVGMSCALLAGCERFTESETSPITSTFRLPQREMEDNSVALAVGIAELDVEQKVEFGELIQKADWLDVDIETRKSLDQNGLQVAVIPDSATVYLDQLLADDSGQEVGIATSHLKTHRRVQNRIGQGFDAAVSATQPQLNWTIHLSDQTISDSAAKAHCVFRITAHAESSRQIRLSLTPEIHHGNKKSWIAVADNNFRFQDRQAIETLDELTFEVIVEKGETVIVSPTPAMERLGKIFLGMQTAPPANEEVSGSQVSKLDTEQIGEFFPMLEQEIAFDVSEQDDPPLPENRLRLGESFVSPLVSSIEPWQRVLLIRLIDLKN